MRTTTRCVLALVATWSGTVAVIFVIQSLQPTPRKFVTYVAEHPLQDHDGSKRVKIIDHVARMLNGLSLEQRQELKASGTIRSFFTQLTHDERRRFLAMTLPKGFHQLIATLNKMDPTQRKRLAQRTLRNVRRHGVESFEIGGEDEVTIMVSQGLEIFNEKASPEVKRDFAEVIKELERKRETSHTKDISQ